VHRGNPEIGHHEIANREVGHGLSSPFQASRFSIFSFHDFHPMTTPLLAFGAHPDDVEFAIGGVIAQETRAGRAAHIVVCSRGESGTSGTPEQRSREAETGAAALGATLEFAECGGDAHFDFTTPHTLTLAAIIRRIRPAIVFAPSVVENQHPDHAKLGRMVRDAARLARYGGVAELDAQPRHAIHTLCYYAVSHDAEPRDLLPVLIDVSASEVVAAWTAAMQAHASQALTRDYVDLQLNRARLHGARCGVSRAIALFPAEPLVFDSLSPLGRSARRF
jgi:LmbE family N-acetylglucosaminyl deacetylase